MIKKIIIYSMIFLVSVFLIAPLLRAQYYEDQPEPISLDLKGMDIKDVLRILSQKSGLNIVADKDVKGTVSLYLRDIDVMDALDIVILTNSLAYERKGTLIRVMTDKSYEGLYGKKFTDKTETEIINLDYATASDVAKSITKMKTKLGKIIPDDHSNTIVLIDSPESIKDMEKVISSMDVPLATKMFSVDIGTIKSDERTDKVVVKDTAKKIKDVGNVLDAFDEKTKEEESYLNNRGEKEKPSKIKRPKKPGFNLSVKTKPRIRHRKRKIKWQPLLTYRPIDRSTQKIRKPRGREMGTALPKKTTYEEYYLTVREEINYIAARQDVSGIKGEVKVQFALNKEGFIIRGPTVLNKPDLKLVRNAVNCVKEAVPFPVFPRKMGKDKAEFLVVVRYE